MTTDANTEQTTSNEAPTQQLPNVDHIFAKPAPAEAQRETCGNCHFARMQINGRNVVMECRYDAPKVNHIPGPGGQLATIGAFPPTRKELWCGKWSPRAKA